MGRDEFNNVSINNERQLRGVEFGPTTREESFFHRENKTNREELNTSQPKDELNEGVVSNKKTITEEKKRNKELEKQLEKESTSNGSNSASSTSSSTSTSASSTSSSSAAASSSGAAAASSGAASAASAVTASASVVVVSAFTVIAAAPIIMSQAKAEMLMFEVGVNEVFYELELTDVMEDEQYRVVLSNKTYSDTRELTEGMNHGEFYNLEANTEYDLAVEEGDDTEIKRTLLKKTFTTQEGYMPIEEFNGISFDKTANFVDKYFEIQLNYVDEGDIYSDFTFVLTDTNNSELTYAFPLTKTTEIQTVYLETSNINFELDSTFTYTISYKENGQEVIYNGEIFTFTDTSGASSEFIGGSVSTYADYLESTFSANIEFIDDFNVIDNIYLVIYDKELGESSAHKIALEKTRESQTLSASDMDLENGVFNYYFQYLYKGDLQRTDTEEVVFVDKSDRKSVLTSAIVNSKADFVERTFEIELNYTDDYGWLSDFVLHISDAELIADSEPFSREYPLKKTLEAQTLSSDEDDENPGFELDNGSYSYYISYKRKGVELTTKTTTITFEDVLDRKSIFNGITIEEADFVAKTFDVQLDVDDGLNRMDNFRLTLTDTDKELSVTCDLLEDSSVQTFSCFDEFNEEYIDLEHASLSYTLTYTNNGVDEEVTNTTSFSDKNGKISRFNEPFWDTDDDGNAYYNFVTGVLNLTLDYEDYFDYFADATLVLNNVGSEDTYEIELDKSLDEQTLDASMAMEYMVDLTTGEAMEYKIIYHTIYDPDTSITGISGTVTFTDSSVSEIKNIEIGEINYDSSYDIPYKLDFIDERSELHDLSMSLKYIDEEDGLEKGTYLIQFTDDSYPYMDDKWQHAYFSTDLDLSDFIALEVTNSSDDVVYRQDVTLSTDALSGTWEVKDIRFAPYCWSGSLEDENCSISYQYAYMIGDYYPNTYDIKFIDGDGNEYVVHDIDTKESWGYSGSFSFLTAEYTDFITKALAGESFEIHIIYTASEVTHDVLCYESFSFI